jgi:acyl dehydratase
MHDREHGHPSLTELSLGQEIPELIKQPTTRTLVQYAGASGDFYEIHYDDAFARAAGLPGVIVHGSLKGAWLAQLVTGWLGTAGRLTELSLRYQGIDVPGRPYRCRGVIRSIKDQEVELEIWGENDEGVRTTTGVAQVAFARPAAP